MNFCPECTGKLTQQLVKGDTIPRLVCSRCGYIYYINPEVLVATIPVQDGKVIMLQRRIEPRARAWTSQRASWRLERL